MRSGAPRPPDALCAPRALTYAPCPLHRIPNSILVLGSEGAREAAEAEAARLKAAGVDAVIVIDRATSPAVSSVSNGSQVVQIGAFRKERNARQLSGRLQRKGEQPFTVASHGLTLVYIGPFETLRDAVAAGERLRRAGFDGFVTRR